MPPSDGAHSRRRALYILCEEFKSPFRSYRQDVTEMARQYASGLMQTGDSKNMDIIAEVVPDSKSRNLQKFLTHSKWVV